MGYHERFDEEFLARYQAPPWLTNRAWEILAYRARSGWTFCPRTYNMIPNDSMVLRCARTDDVNGLQALFVQKKASPFDYSPNDFTPLQVSQHVLT